MTRIRTREQLKALYPRHYNVLLGYWMSGMREKEHLDKFVEVLEAKKARGKKTTQPKPPS